MEAMAERLKVHPDDRTGARQFLQGFVPHLDAGCIGSINEIFDAEPPFTPRGCIAQAWSGGSVARLGEDGEMMLSTNRWCF